jgi:hypothetical protein
VHGDSKFRPARRCRGGQTRATERGPDSDHRTEVNVTRRRWPPSQARSQLDGGRPWARCAVLSESFSVEPFNSSFESWASESQCTPQHKAAAHLFESQKHLKRCRVFFDNKETFKRLPNGC